MSFTIWFTGLSGAGKTTLSGMLELELKGMGLKVERLDGDTVRSCLGDMLRFSDRDRCLNMRYLGLCSYMLNRNGVVAIVAAISPFSKERERNRQLIDRYVEVFCDIPLDAAIKRDVKGLYRKAVAGEIENFTGVSSPYERPEAPEISVRTDQEALEQTFAHIMRYLREAGYLTQALGAGQSIASTTSEARHLERP